MDKSMSKMTKGEILAKLSRRYASAGAEHKSKLIDQVVSLLGYHRKSAIRALNAPPNPSPRPLRRGGRPREYESKEMLPVLRKIWDGASYPCGKRLVAMLPDWLEGYEQTVRSVSSGVKDQILGASARTLDRLLEPLRAQRPGRNLTRPGSLLRQQIPIRGGLWDEGKAGWLEVDTVALCGGSVAGDFVWMVDAVDYVTAWVSVRAIWNRGQESTLQALKNMEQTLPFALLGLDSDNGGEFINHHVVRWLQQRPRPVYFTRSRPCKKDDNAHVEQKNWTHIRQWFGYERYGQPELLGPMNELTRGPYGQLLNYFHASMKLQSKEHQPNGRLKRVYEAAQTPLARVLASPEVSAQTKAELRRQKSRLNPFELKREVDRRLKEIHVLRCKIQK
jgi:hypothetical protein